MGLFHNKFSRDYKHEMSLCLYYITETGDEQREQTETDTEQQQQEEQQQTTEEDGNVEGGVTSLGKHLR